MRITQLQLKSFRCFDLLNLSFDAPLMVIEGANGVGKTSLLEAFHFLCYLRSFRTHLPQELMKFGHESFFIKAMLEDEHDTNELQVGFNNKKRLVKVNNKSVASYKELLHYYRIVTLTEDDLALIKEGPELRRLFIDQVITLLDADFITILKKCRDITTQRNALLKNGGSLDSYTLWTDQLWHTTFLIQEKRIAALNALEHGIRELVQEYFKDIFRITFTYTPKKSLLSSIDEFRNANVYLYHNEQRFGRSLFGAHLDDFTINFQDTLCKQYASRGQQKLIIVLLKAAQILLLKKKGLPAIFLLDDFITDFDEQKAQILLTLLQNLGIQLIFTIPSLLGQGFLQKELRARGGSFLTLPS